MQKRIYAADDDQNIRNLIQSFLQNEGYEVSTFADGDALYSAFLRQTPDLVILDVMMPGTDGLTVCANIRKVSKVPIIILTAKDSDTDQVVGITLGGDDYLTKPFRPTLLMLRVKALLRRVDMEREAQSSREEPGDIDCGDLHFAHQQRCVYCKQRDLKLTGTELNCMVYLMLREEAAVSREALLEAVWGYDQEVETRVTDETIRRIRKKLQQADTQMRICTIWGYGYKLTRERGMA